MATYKVAQLKEQGLDLIIVPMDSKFGHMSAMDQAKLIGQIQAQAKAVKLKGSVIPVWEGVNGHLSCIAPKHWHAFFRRLTMEEVHGILNNEITC